MISSLQRDVDWLNARFNEVEPRASRMEVDRLRSVVQGMLESGTPGPALRSMELDLIRAILKLLTIRFHLRNKAEQVHIARINRQREQSATAGAPRPESLQEAIETLASDGCSLPRLVEILATLDICPTLTAHPTESRRRSILEKQRHIGDLLALLDRPDRTPRDHARAASGVRQTLTLLLATDEVRARRLEVIDEVRNGVRYLAGTIWDAIPTLYHDLAEAIDGSYGESVELPVMMRYRSWIGGDRDGNPNVTAVRTRQSLEEMRRAAVARYAGALEQLERELSLSDRRVRISDRLLDSIRRDDAEHPLDAAAVRHLRHEPFRVKLRHMLAQLGTRTYSAGRFVDDLTTLRDAVMEAGLTEVATRGLLSDTILRARTFGFHLAALDIRQHSRVHESSVAELFRIAGVESDYAALDETARRRLLRAELESSRPLLAPHSEVSAECREVLDTLQVVAEVRQSEPDAIGSYVVSMAHDVSDLLEVVVLLREVGLCGIEAGVASCSLDITPLFETVDDLAGAARVMREVLEEPAYRAHLEARSRFQEVMLGYSDSNKDGGYWAANWRLFHAQDELAKTCVEAGVSFRFFHGRGGTVARGGGRAHRAVLASPPSAGNGRIRFTEQGEVISFRYATPALAHRHLEQIINALIRVTAAPQTAPTTMTELAPLMDALAERSRAAYRALIDDPAFWPWFVECSPVRHIGELPIASRPVSRTGGALCFDNLRAIPWVFAWTQMRYVAPGWYGIGSAFSELVMDDPSALERCRASYRAGGHFGAVIDNAQQEMARARLAVGSWYAGETGSKLHDQLAREFALAERAVLSITGQHALLDNNPVIQQSIHARNPDTDLINALQVELLRRWRESTDQERPALSAVILLSVNALAAAMQSTG
ncbi:MAG: phosphoenolpyruvate carboxylase [Planctomycetota bacterium]|jgi:phosphoenolpyruvate carboxylase